MACIIIVFGHLSQMNIGFIDAKTVRKNGKESLGQVEGRKEKVSTGRKPGKYQQSYHEWLCANKLSL